jgi:hypothetical protein
MRRTWIAILSAVALFTIVGAPVSSAATRAADCVPAAKCCKVCDKGQACGNSCISASKQCHKGRGCACNAGEVCPSGG